MGGGGGAFGIARATGRAGVTFVTVLVRGALGLPVRGVDGREGFALPESPRRSFDGASCIL